MQAAANRSASSGVTGLLRRQPQIGGWARHVANQAGEAAAVGDHQHPRALGRLDPERVRRPARRHQRLPGAGDELLRADPEADDARLDVKDLILVVMDVQRRRVAERHEMVRDGHADRRVGHGDVTVEEPEAVAGRKGSIHRDTCLRCVE